MWMNVHMQMGIAVVFVSTLLDHSYVYANKGINLQLIKELVKVNVYDMYYTL